MTADLESALRLFAIAMAAIVAILIGAGLLLRRNSVQERKQSRLRHPAFTRTSQAARFIRRRILSMSPGEIRRRFDRIVAFNFPEAARADEHFDRIANEVVPDTAKPKPHHDGGNK